MDDPSGADYNLYLVSPFGEQVAASENPWGDPELILYADPGQGWYDYRVRVKSYADAYFSPDSYSLEVDVFSDPCEPNESHAAACLISGGWRDFYIRPEGEEDWFKFNVYPPVDYYAHLEAWVQSIPTGVNYDLELYDFSSSPTLLDYSYNSGNANEYADENWLEASGQYRIRVFPANGYSHTDSYRLLVQVTYSPLLDRAPTYPPVGRE
jgi:hypothetical protein